MNGTWPKTRQLVSVCLILCLGAACVRQTVGLTVPPPTKAPTAPPVETAVPTTTPLPTPSPMSPSPGVPSPTAFPTATDTALPPSPTTAITVTLLPASPAAAFTVTAKPSSPTAAASETPSQAGGKQVKVFLIAIDDNGKAGKKIGCGDSVVAVTRPITATPGVLRAALESLFAIKDTYYGQSGLYNALAQSDLHVQGITIAMGVATIKLTGTVKMGGECDIPRVEAQLTETALQFSTVKVASIFVNGRPLKDVLSLK